LYHLIDPQKVSQTPKIQPKGDFMLKRQLGALFLVICISLAALPIVLGSISNDQTSEKDSGSQKSAEGEISKVSELIPAPKNPEFVKFQMNKV
jgi:hypothetical protein